MQRRAGFSIIELLIVLGITAVISVIAVLALVGTRGGNNAKNTASEIGALLREAQSRSINQQNGATWGVHFDNTTGAPFFALFSGTYSANTRVGVNPLPSGILFDPSSLASGATLDITFAQVTGLPSTSTAITLDYAPTGFQSSSTAASVSRTGSGKVFFDDFNRSNL